MSLFGFPSPGSAARSCDFSLYSRDALRDSMAAFQEFCNVTITELPGNCGLVAISPKTTESNRCRAIVLEFWNYWLAKSLQEHLGISGDQ